MMHKHHVIPRYAGGTDDASNIILLTVEQHAEAHRLLYEKYGRWQDRVAWQGLAGIIGHEDAVKQACGWGKGRKHKPETIEKMRKPKTLEHATKAGLAKRGMKHSEEAKRKMSATRKLHGQPPMSEEHRQKLSEYSRKPKSEETKEKMRVARKLFWERKRMCSK